MSNVNVNFKVSGGDLSSFIEEMKRKSDELSNQLIDNAQREGGTAKDQLDSYQRQIVTLERKARLQYDIAQRAAAEKRRDAYDQSSTMRDEYLDEIDEAVRRGDRTEDWGVRQKKFAESDFQAEIGQIDASYTQSMKAAEEERRDAQVLLRAVRGNADAIREESKEQLGQMRRGDDDLIDAVEESATPSERLVNQLASEERVGELEDEKDKGEINESAFGSVIKALSVDRVGGTIAQMPSANNELDFVRPIITTTMTAIGGLLGNLIDAANIDVLGTGLGQTSFGALGTQLGEKFGEFAGAAVERTYRSRDELSQVNYRLQATTGRDYDVESEGIDGAAGRGLSSMIRDLSQYGLSFQQASEAQLKLAQAQGTSRNLMSGTENMVAVLQGLGVQNESFLGLTEVLRSSSKENQDVMRLIGGVASAGSSNLFAGGDRTFLNEFLQKNFSSLQKTLLNTQNTVATGTTFDILKRFDSIGGPFSARDPRSTGLVNTVHNSLVNPGSDNARVLATMAMRRDNPEMDFYEIERERQRGLSSPTFLRSMIEMVEGIGGSESMQKFNLAQILGLEGNLAAMDTLFKNREAFMRGEISSEELVGSGQYSEEAIRATGQDQTSRYTKSSADIENAFIESSVDGIKVVGEKMKGLFSTMIDDVETYIKKEMEFLLRKNDRPAVNKTYTPGVLKMGGN